VLSFYLAFFPSFFVCCVFLSVWLFLSLLIIVCSVFHLFNTFFSESFYLPFSFPEKLKLQHYVCSRCFGGAWTRHSTVSEESFCFKNSQFPSNLNGRVRRSYVAENKLSSMVATVVERNANEAIAEFVVESGVICIWQESVVRLSVFVSLLTGICLQSLWRFLYV
jgi:hypothetical protein